MDMRALFFDLDDTLLNSDKTISEANAAAIKACSARGIFIGYLTARSTDRVGGFLNDLPCDAIAYYNGAYVFVNGKLIERNEIQFDSGVRIIENIKMKYPDTSIGAYLEPYSYKDGSVLNIVTKELYSCYVGELPRFDFQRIRLEFDMYNEFQIAECLTDDVKLFRSIHQNAFITHRNADKVNALGRILEKMGIPLSQAVVFGDDVNDIEVIKATGVGVAMGNAIDEVKAVADFVCDTNDNDGVGKWINSYLL